MSQLNKILIGAFVLQFALVVFVWGNRDKPEMEKSSPVLSDFDAGEISKLEILDGSNKDNKPLIMEKKGEDWVLTSHRGFPVKKSKVEELASNLASMKTRGPAATKESRHKQLKVAADDFHRRIVVTAGSKTRTVYVGGSLGQRMSAVRVDGNNDIHGVVGMASYSIASSASNWVETKVLDLEGDKGLRLQVQNKNGSFAFSKDKSGTWTVTTGALAEGQNFNKDALPPLLRKLATLNAYGPASNEEEAAFGFDKLTATVSANYGDYPAEAAQTEEASTVAPLVSDAVVLEIGAEKSSRFFARLQGSEQVFVVNKSTVEEFVDMSPEKYSSAPAPAPAP